MNMKIFVFSAFIILAESYLNQINIEDRSDLETEWEIISEFMKDQHVVTLFVQKHYEYLGDRILKYSLTNYKFGLFRYNNVTLISKFYKSFRKYAIYTGRVYGCILVIHDLTTMESVIRASENNRLVLVFFDVNVESIKRFMLKIWNGEKTFEMIALSIQGDGQNKIIQINPFKSKYYEYSISDKNSSHSIVAQINYRLKLFMSNMAGYPVKVLIFEFPLVSVLVRNSSGQVVDATSLDGTLLKLCKKFMNFTPIYENDILSKTRNITGIGSAKLIDSGMGEVGINNRILIDVAYNNTVFLYPTNKLQMCFIVPVNYEAVPLNILTYECFDVKSRIVIAVSLIVLSLIWVLGQLLIEKNEEIATVAIPLKVFALLHSVSVIAPRLMFNQVIFITITLFSLLLTSIYQGTIVEQLNHPLKPQQLNSLKDLLDSNLNITMLRNINRSVKNVKQGTDDNKIMLGEIGVKTVKQFATIPEGLDMVAYNKTTAFMMPLIRYGPFGVKYFDKTTGLDLLHLIKESPSSMFGSSVIARNSPYIAVFNRVLRISFESGILDHEMAIASDQKRLYYIRRIKEGYVPKDNRFRPILFSDLSYLRAFIIGNWILSTIIFFLEHILHIFLKYRYKYKWFSTGTEIRMY